MNGQPSHEELCERDASFDGCFDRIKVPPGSPGADQAIENLLKKGPLKTRGLAARIDSDRLGLISYDT